MPSEVRFGIIGCGEIAMQTCTAIDAATNARIAMLMDERPEVTADLAEYYSSPATTDVEEVLANPEVDAVYIAVPHDLHAQLGIRAARAGKHVLVEKPIATTLEDADALIAACRENNVRLGVAFLAQGDPSLAACRDLVRAGMLGKIISVRINQAARKPDSYWGGGYTGRVPSGWRTQKARSGGGMLIMNTSHDLNTVRWVTGLEVRRVYAEMGTLATAVEVEDTLAATLRYDNDAIGVVHIGSAMVGAEHESVRGPRVYGDKGQLILAREPLICLADPPEGGAPNVWQKVRFAGEAPADGGRRAMVEGFAAAVLAGAEPPVTGLDGRKSLEIVLAAYRSAELGRPVELK